MFDKEGLILVWVSSKCQFYLSIKHSESPIRLELARATTMAMCNYMLIRHTETGDTQFMCEAAFPTRSSPLCTFYQSAQ